MKRLGGIMLLLLALAGCGGGMRYGAGVRIVAAFSPLVDAAHRIDAMAAEITNITPSGAEPHDIELSANDVLDLRTADLVIYMGGNFQPALRDGVHGLPAKVRKVDVLAGLPVKGDDPHVWLDPVLMQRIAIKIGDAIAKVETAEADTVRAHTAEYVKDLQALDTEYRSGLKDCPRREIFTAHEAFGYLAARYGLTQYPLTGLSPDAEPSARHLQEVIRLVRAHHATTIFFETLLSSRVATKVASATQTNGAILNPIEGLTLKEQRENDDYLSLMRKNLATLRTALGCR